MNTLLTNAVAIISMLVTAFSIIYALWVIEKNRKREKVIVAEAGKISDTGQEYQPYIYMNPVTLRSQNGREVIDQSDLIRIFVHGHCMEPIGIMDKSQLFAKKIRPHTNLALQVKHDDILLIYLADVQKFKIRRFDKYDKDNNLQTYRYNPTTGEIIVSSRPHTPQSVVGVVKYKYA